MNFNEHSELIGRHAYFSPSQSSWLRYDDNKLVTSYLNRNRKTLGTEIHEFAQSQIELLQKVTGTRQVVHDIATYIYIKYKERGIIEHGKNLILSLNELPSEIFDTLKIFINDAIGYRMNSEVVLKYSNRFFGTTDAIAFKNNFLRIHDLKTGDGEAHIEQLLIYVALFCLEYKIKPSEIQIELRLYQYGDFTFCNPSIDDIVPIMDKIVSSDKILMSRIDDEEEN